MRFLGIGDTCDLGALYLRLQEDGHEVKVFISDPMAHGTLAGLIRRTSDWRTELAWIAEAGLQGVLLFENVAESRGALQDELRGAGYNVIGGSAYGDRLENDRAYAQQVLAGLGLPVCKIHEFTHREEAENFLRANPGRYVLKWNGPGFSSGDNYVGQLSDGRDVRAMLSSKLSNAGRRPSSFVLMEHVSGIEMGVGAYFDGTEFVEGACLDWEHKRFFPGDLGELTGEMGTVATYARSHTFFEQTLGRMAPLLRKGRYCGYINLNTIVNEQGIWPLEFTCRFGYPGFAVLEPLQQTPWGELFRRIVAKDGTPFITRSGFSVGIVLTVPPFPYTRKDVEEAVGHPVLFSGALSEEEIRHIHYGEVGMDQGQLSTSGCYGWTMVVTGTGATIGAAKDRAVRLAAKVLAPNLRYRNDIGDRLMQGDFREVERLGLLDLQADENLPA